MELLPFLLATTSLLLACVLQTRLKWVACVPLPFIVVMLLNPSQPDVLISEDAKLVAVRTADGTLAINRKRANQFTIKTWLKALNVEAVTSPVLDHQTGSTGAFTCTNNICSIVLANGEVLTWVGYPTPPRRPAESGLTQQGASDLGAIQQHNTALADYRAAVEALLFAKFKADLARACKTADLIVASGPVDFSHCPRSGVSVISAQTLAKRGTLEIHLNNKFKGMYLDVDVDKINSTQRSSETEATDRSAGKSTKYTLVFAVDHPNRPWNAARIHSRAARNLPPFQPIAGDNKVSTGGSIPPSDPAP